MPELAGVLADVGDATTARPRPGRSAPRRRRRSPPRTPPGTPALVATRSAARVRTRSGSQTTAIAARGQHVDQQLHVVDQHRRQRLHALDRDALGDLAEQFAPARGAPRRSCGGPRPHLVGQQQLAAGRRPQAVLGDLQRALVGDLEVADLLDVVAPELHPQRVLLGRREDVQDAAAHGELAALLDQLDPGVRGGRQAVDDVAQVGAAARCAAPTGSRSPSPLTCGCSTERTGATTTWHRAGRRVVGPRVREPAQHGEPAADGVASAARAARAAASPRPGTPRPRPAGSSERSAAARSSASRPVAVTASTGAAGLGRRAPPRTKGRAPGGPTRSSHAAGCRRPRP